MPAVLRRLRTMLSRLRSIPRSIRYFFADLWHWLWSHRLVLTAVVLVLVGAAGAGAYLIVERDGDEGPAAGAPAPDVIVGQVAAPDDAADELETEDLGFPAFATKNTTRVGGPDPASNAAGVALAVDPATGGVGGPDAVTLVDAGEWQAGIAAASLAADPVGAPILLTDGGEVPALTANALRALAPAGSAETDGTQLFAVGAAPAPDGYDSLQLHGENPAEIASEIDRLRQRLDGDPEHVLVASADEPGLAMPAAGWAARSGDPVLFARRDTLPDATREALREHKGAPVYVLGPESAISARTLREIEKVAPNALRLGEDEPTANSIAFARYADGTFGWNINDPGHGFVILNARLPIDAAAAAPLSASGTWGTQLVVEDGSAVPAELRGYLLDLKPGYDDDPTRAVYNHVWLIGDQETLSVDFQAQIDELAEVTQVTSGGGR
ncbi:MAG: hypothetical protein ACRDK9_12200 [Solirubrobacterales bacterium]